MTVDEGLAELYHAARAVAVPTTLSPWASAGGVGAALRSATGAIATGVCLDTACSMGFCAEHAAAAALVARGQSRVAAMVAVGADGRVLAPCGRCRELVRQLHADNGDAEVLVARGRVVALDDLLPFDWRD